jgi:DNA-binding HxlR family transcriptional regulator
MAKAAKASKSSQPNDLKLADFLCFALYSANLTFGNAYKTLLDALGLTYTQYIAVVALYEESNQTVSGLGEKLFLESNTLTPILKKLESLGYVSRERDSADERQVIVNLTKEGRACANGPTARTCSKPPARVWTSSWTPATPCSRCATTWPRSLRK